jgi:hypothetical protein
LVWDDAEAVELDGAPALVMSPEDLIVFVCFHASHHDCFTAVGLRPLVDIARICARDDAIDWHRVVERAQSFHWERGLALTLLTARMAIGSEVPEWVAKTLVSRCPDLESVCEAALNEMCLGVSSAMRFSPNLLALERSSSLREKASRMTSRLFPPREELFREFDRSAEEETSAFALIALYLRRIGRLLPRHGPKLIALLRNAPEQRSQLDRRRLLASWLDPNLDG